jgi:hypothetical protein
LLDVPSGQGPCWPCVPPSWPWLTRQALLRGLAGRHVSPGQRALAAAGHWRLQAGPHCDAGPSCSRPAPAAGTHHLASPWPHWLTSSTSARATTAPRALPPCSSSVSVGPPLFAGRCAEQRASREALTPLRARVCRPLHLKHFSIQICVETCKGCRARPAR